MYTEVKDKDTLIPGDTVGIMKPTRLGWHSFRYPRIIPMTIKRITPARTKFTMTNGWEFKKETFYELTEEAQEKTQIAESALKLHSLICNLETIHRNGSLYTQNDDFIVMAADLLERVYNAVDHKDRP